MKQIAIYLFDDGNSVNSNTLLINNDSYFNIKSLQSNHICVSEVDITNIPNSCEHDAIIFLSKNTFISKDYIEKSISAMEMLGDFGVICGPTKVIGDKLSRFYEYDLRFQSSIINNISSEDHNYPQINGAIISKKAYNNFMYAPTISGRHSSFNNKSFLYSVSKQYPIYYISTLKKLYNIEKHNIDSLFAYYYDCGYQDGNLLSYQQTEERNKNIWHKFVESPESIDREMPRWFSIKDFDINNIEILERTIIIKCKYQIGFLEGLMNKNLI